MRIMDHSKVTKLILQVAIVVALSGCARYYSRAFVLRESPDRQPRIGGKQYGVACGDYLIHPEVWAYTGALASGLHHPWIEGPLQDYQDFAVGVSLDVASGTNTPLVLRTLRSVRIDGVKLSFYGDVESMTLPLTKASESHVHGEASYGVGYSYGRVNIPKVVDSLLLSFEIVVTDTSLVNLDCDTLTFKMYRFEESKRGFYNP